MVLHPRRLHVGGAELFNKSFIQCNNILRIAEFEKNILALYERGTNVFSAFHSDAVNHILNVD